MTSAFVHLRSQEWSVVARIFVLVHCRQDLPQFESDKCKWTKTANTIKHVIKNDNEYQIDATCSPRQPYIRCFSPLLCNLAPQQRGLILTQVKAVKLLFSLAPVSFHSVFSFFDLPLRLSCDDRVVFEFDGMLCIICKIERVGTPPLYLLLNGNCIL